MASEVKKCHYNISPSKQLTILLILITCACGSLFAQDTLKISEGKNIINLKSFLQSNPRGELSISEVTKSDFGDVPSEDISRIQWLKFTVKNTMHIKFDAKVNITFTDSIDFYVFDEGNQQIKHVQTGDLFPIPKREVSTGMMVFVNLSIPPQETRTCYLKLQSVSNISEQFKDIALRSSNIYPEKTFQERFIEEKTYQALFYGALFIMLFYNFFIYLTLNNKSYLFYILFLSSLIVFLSSNSGYLVEVLIPTYPRLDLYIRFLSPVLVILSYLIFSRHFLDPESKILNKLIDILIYSVSAIAIIMVMGLWRTGRTLMIALAVISFVTILIAALKEIKSGFTPARYFLAANALFIIGGIMYALTRISIVVQNPLTQHVTQVAIAFEVALLSLGLADRINMIRKELSQKVIENATLEKQRSIERRALIEEKNEALTKSYNELDTFIYKTAHYIRGPIARLLGISNVALVDVKNQHAKSYFERFNNDSNRLHKIVKRLSTAHEINVLDIEFTEIQLEKHVKAILFEKREGLNGIKISTNLDQIYIDSDLRLIHTIITELIENAAQFSNKDAQDSFLKINAAMSGDRLIFNVIDNGIGVKEEDKDGLFDMFSKAADIHGNPGLGLYIVKIAVKRLGGDFGLVPHDEDLTCFQIKLPLKKSNVLKNLSTLKTRVA